MNYIDILLTILIISLFCCGLTIVTGKDMVGYFLRKPFENIVFKINREKSLLHIEDLNGIDEYNSKVSVCKALLFIFKPIILCCACMASFWGIIIFLALHGFHVEQIKFMIICCIASCFVNAYFISLYNRL